MVPKFDIFQKHVRRCKCKVAKPNCSVGQYYMFAESQHAKNERLFCCKGEDTMVNMVIVGDVVGEKKRKFIQFVEAMKLLFF